MTLEGDHLGDHLGGDTRETRSGSKSKDRVMNLLIGEGMGDAEGAAPVPPEGVGGRALTNISLGPYRCVGSSHKS